MSIPRVLSAAVSAAMLLHTVPATAKVKPRQPVAIVYELTGEAQSIVSGLSGKPVRLYDRLPATSILEVEPGSSLAMAFVSGRRYQLSGPARATLGKGDFSGRSGGVRRLSPVPPLPHLAPIAEGDRPGPTMGAIRIRGGEIEDLCPRDRAATLTGATVLRFRPAGGAARHQVEVEDSRGSVIFHLVTEGSAVSVPDGKLAPGASYHWTVTALDRLGPTVRGEADFVTLAKKVAEARERLRKAVETAGDGGSRALLTAVDHTLGLAGEACARLQAASGVVIEGVKPASGSEKAGLQPGDVILTWSCPAVPPVFPQPSGGAIRLPYDLLTLELEEAPRCPVTLQGKRDGENGSWTLPAEGWRIKARPSLPPDIATLYLEGKAKIEAGDVTAAEPSWRTAVDRARAANQGLLAGWLLDRLARAFAEAGKWSEADAAYEQALAALERESEHAAAAWLLRNWGEGLVRRGAWEAAVERYQRALALDRTTATKSLAVAWTLDCLGIVIAKRGDYLAADELMRQALAMREELAPGTVAVTWSLNNLGILARRRGDLELAEGYLTRGEELLRQLASDSADHALFFQNLGNLAGERGDLQKSDAFYRQALAIFEKTAPNGDGVPDCLQALGNVAMQRGELAAAGELLRRVLSLQERRGGDELAVSSTLLSLGNLASRIGDMEMAEAHYRRALAIQERLSPNGSEASQTLGNLGSVAALRGDFAAARTFLRRSLDLKEKLAPESIFMASSLAQLGRLETDSGGDQELAEDLLRQALAIEEKAAPESLATSDILRDLGEVAVRRGRSTEAIALHRRALDLRHRLAPGTTSEAESLHLLGLAERRAGRQETGTARLCGAIDVLDRQRTKVGGAPETRTAFEASLGDYYFACLEGLIGLGGDAEAFHTLERGRARSFLALLSERDLRLRDLPPELAAERRHLDAEVDQIQSQLAHLSSGRDDAQIERLTAALRDLQARQEDIIARLRRESPRSAALQDPEPLALAAARAALDPGTVLLEYAVGEDKTWLFVVQPAGPAGPGLAVFPIAAGSKTLLEEVGSFRRLLHRPTSDRAALQEKARRLYGLLIHPAEARIAKAQRLLVSPDGPLHTLPFAALMRGDRFLVEWKPIHSVLSATVYAELKRSRPLQPVSGEQRLAAFGDPVYPKSQVPADPEVRETVRRGFGFQPLPSTRAEVEGIVALYPQAKAFLGSEATEEKAKSVGPESRLLHFACHGLLDEKFPLNSALALTLPEAQSEGRDNGLLQAWEIFENLRLDADLVTLSACDTALGKEMGGEGLVGLTRAFQYAGARSVLASLWSISDASTAELMKRFYGYLRGGKAKDEALRAAQIDQIRRKSSASHPFHWAAFELFGDSR